MADVVDRETRSRMMSGIRARNTRPELRLRKALFALGFRYRLHARNLPGRPDIVLPKWRAVIFVHGCFWHRHAGCGFTTYPATRPEFWTAKFRSNIERDSRHLNQLRDLGWRTAIVWECSLRPKGSGSAIAAEVAAWLRSESDRLELPRSLNKTPDQPRRLDPALCPIDIG